MGKPKLTSECFTAEGLTNVQPFSFESRPQQVRIKDTRRDSSPPGGFARTAGSPARRASKFGSLGSPRQMSRKGSPRRGTIPPVESVPVMPIPIQTAEQLESEQTEFNAPASKLFDVDVKIAKDQVIRIEMTDHDDPMTVAKHFQKKFDLSEEAAEALF